MCTINYTGGRIPTTTFCVKTVALCYYVTFWFFSSTSPHSTHSPSFLLPSPFLFLPLLFHYQYLELSPCYLLTPIIAIDSKVFLDFSYLHLLLNIIIVVRNTIVKVFVNTQFDSIISSLF